MMMKRLRPPVAAGLLAIVAVVVATHANSQAQDGSTHSHLDSDEWRGEVITLSESHPRAYLYKNFLSPEECDHLIQLALPNLQESMVENVETGERTLSESRTSRNTFLLLKQDDVVTRIEKRVSLVTHIPQSHGERLQILEYVNGQKYNAHYDFLDNPVNSARIKGGHRQATFLMYLANVEGGGETCFPNANKGKVYGEEWSECAQGKLAVKPRRGDALLFFDTLLDGAKDTFSLHEACPVTEGVKYSATKWLRVYPMDGGCFDNHMQCSIWAEKGECDANPSYMHTDCRKSCQLCEDGTVEAA